MKHFSLLVVLMVLAIGVSAQVNMYVWQNGVKTTYPTNEVDSITFGEDENESEGDAPSGDYTSIIRVDDGSVADWEDVPAAYLFSASTASSAKWTALKQVKVYADEQYINLLVSYDSQQITNTDWVPFHIYINTDNSSTTGGYGDQWMDADTDLMLEAAILSDGAHVSYEPLAFAWIGDVGDNGWAWGALEQGEQVVVGLQAELDVKMAGEYEVYLNLPDAYESLRNNPAFSIRLANENMWDEARGYNYLTNISL